VTVFEPDPDPEAEPPQAASRLDEPPTATAARPPLSRDRRLNAVRSRDSSAITTSRGFEQIQTFSLRNCRQSTA
jgi:hypothetical protein